METINSIHQSFDLQSYSSLPVLTQIPNKIRLPLGEAFRVLPGPIARKVLAIWVSPDKMPIGLHGIDSSYNYDIGNWYLIHDRVAEAGLLDDFLQERLDLYLAVTAIGEFFIFPIISKCMDIDLEIRELDLYRRMHRLCHDAMIEAQSLSRLTAGGFASYKAENFDFEMLANTNPEDILRGFCKGYFIDDERHPLLDPNDPRREWLP